MIGEIAVEAKCCFTCNIPPISDAIDTKIM